MNKHLSSKLLNIYRGKLKYLSKVSNYNKLDNSLTCSLNHKVFMHALQWPTNGIIRQMLKGTVRGLNAKWCKLLSKSTQTKATNCNVMHWGPFLVKTWAIMRSFALLQCQIISNINEQTLTWIYQMWPSRFTVVHIENNIIINKS